MSQLFCSIFTSKASLVGIIVLLMFSAVRFMLLSLLFAIAPIPLVNGQERDNFIKTDKWMSSLGMVGFVIILVLFSLSAAIFIIASSTMDSR